MSGRPERPEALSSRKYWDSILSGRKVSGAPSYVRAARRILGPSTAAKMGSYEDYLLWNVIYPSYLTGSEGCSVVEIGSAPGRHLVRMREKLGCEVWGLEYSPGGAEANREAFRRAGIDPDRVIEADLFDGAVAGRFSGKFDVVLSRGLIEHFDDPRRAVEIHLQLLRPGGTLMVSIPNMRGANYLQALLFNRRLIPMHNREIMRMGVFRSLFARKDLETLFCGYYGTAKADLFIHRRGPLTGFIMRAAEAFQALLNLLFRLVLRDRGLETSLFSPNLLFIGVKKH
jgi:SAM-dependent methyltransferase